MKTRIALVFLLLSACGAERDEPRVSLAFGLSAETAAKVTELQVAFVRSGSVDCERLRATCLKSVGVTTVPLAGAQAGRAAYRAPFTAAQAGTLVPVTVDAGTYLVNVEALDSSGNLVANACRLKVELAAGAATELSLTLADYTGPTCAAGL